MKRNEQGTREKENKDARWFAVGHKEIKRAGGWAACLGAKGILFSERAGKGQELRGKYG